MPFSYDITQPIGKLRLAIGDRVSGAGPWPDGSNFTDEELTQLLNDEGSQGRAQAAVAEVLSAAWASIVSVSEGPLSVQANHASETLMKLAVKLREQYGGLYLTYSLQFRRNDGYAMYGGENPLIGANLSDYFRARLIIRRGWTS